MKELFFDKNNFKYMAVIFVSLFSAVLMLHFTFLDGAAAGIVNINSDKFERLLDIPGVDEIIAAKILKYRKDNNGFKTIYDLMKITEITGEAFEKMKDSITVGEKTASQQPAKTQPRPPQQPAAPGTPPAGAMAPARTADDEGSGEKSSQAARIAENSAGDEQPASDDSSTEQLSDEGRTNSPKVEPVRPARPIRGRIDDIKRIDITAENYYKIIMSLMRMGKYEQAEKSLNEFIEKFPDDARADDARYLLGACYEEREKFSEAMAIYTKVYDNTKSELRGISLFRTAVCMDVLGNSKDALETYRKYISEFPDSSCVKDAEDRVSNMVKVK